MDFVFVVNAGSSSLKYQLINMENESVLAGGNCERIGIDGGILTYKYDGKKKVLNMDLPNHRMALTHVVELLTTGETKVVDNLDNIVAVGHRFAFSTSQSNEVTPEVEQEIASHNDMFPLHNPAMLTGLHACQEVFPDKVHVAVYDNSFHLTMPDKAYMYAIPYEYYEKYGIRRYGYHGTSHRYVSLRLAEILGKNPEDLKIVTCHLGNGSSVAAIDGGISVDTSMGYTPLAGVMMGTRCGDIDPSILSTLAKKENISLDDVMSILNKKSGLLGISGISSDARDVVNASHDGNKRAALACHMVRYQVKKLIGAYAAVMGGLDAVIFTGGMGENSPELREEICKSLAFFGIKIDPAKNDNVRGVEACLTTDDSTTQVWLIPTNEELMIARDAYAIFQEKQKA